ncbi:hypothetical protein D3C77_531960 [compost metagenome]
MVVQPLCPGGPVAVLPAGVRAAHGGDLAGQPAHHPLHRPDATGAATLLRRVAELAGIRTLYADLPAVPLLERAVQRPYGPQGVAGLPELHGAGGRGGGAHLASWLSGLPAGGAGVYRGQHSALWLQPGAHGLPAQRRGAGADGQARGQCTALSLHVDGQLPLHLRGVAALYPVPGTGPASAGQPGSPDGPAQPAWLYGALCDCTQTGGAGGAGSR